MALPTIVAGPIVRRVEPNLATVWVALSESAMVTLDIYQGPTAAGSGAPDFTSGQVATRPFGANLHVIAVTVGPDGVSLQPNTTYAYNLTFDLWSGGLFDLQGLGLLEDETTKEGRIQQGVHPEAPFNLALGYAKDQLPTFLTCPSDLKDLVLVQAGCRNTSSSKQDAAGWIDEAISDSSLQRPHQLLMTGDQVYADSFNTVLLPMANGIGAELLGLNPESSPIETMLAVLDEDPQGPGSTGANSEISVDMVNFPAGRRSWLCKDHAGATTGSTSHLLSFGEFAAAYCMAWNPSIWRLPAEVDDLYTDLFPDHPLSEIDDYLTSWEHLRSKGGKELPLNKWLERKQGKVEDWTRRIELYRSTIPQIRRSMANCPTYMMHDDHEITDDWNASQEWADRVYSKPLGRQLLRNGMSANAIFQAWGNDPEGWKSGTKGTFLNNVSAAWTTTNAEGHLPDDQFADDIEDALKLPPATGLVDWHCTITNNSHKLLIIDTRTKRSFETRTGPARLLGGTITAQVPTKPATPADDRLIVLLSPQPPLFPALFDQIAQPLAGAIVSTLASAKNAQKKRKDRTKDPAPHELSEMGDTVLEGESWGLEQIGLEQLLKQLNSYSRALIISGDVHFSYAMEMDYWKKGATTPSRFVQLTVSPSRHQWPEMVHDLLRTSALTSRFAELGHPAERLGWDEKGDTPTTPTLPPYGIATRADQTPALLPSKGWPVGTTVDKPPDWTWRLDLAADVREDLDRPDSIHLPAIPATDSHDPQPANPLDTYPRLAEAHQGQARKQFSHMRRLVFPTAIGVITFPEVDVGDPAGDHQHVRHEIWTADPDNPASVNRNNVGEPNTLHLIDLEPTTDSQPTLQIGTGGS